MSPIIETSRPSRTRDRRTGAAVYRAAPLFALNLALLGAVGCGHSRATPRNVDISPWPKMETVKPEYVYLPDQIELSAIVDAMEKADLCARIPGVVESFQIDGATLKIDPNKPEVDIGRRVTAGEPLVKLAVPDVVADLEYKKALLDQARKQLEVSVEAQRVAAQDLRESQETLRRFEAELELRRSKHERTTRLVGNTTLAPELADESRKELKAAESAYNAGEAAVQTKQAKLEAAAADLKLSQSKIEVAQADVKKLQTLVDYSIVRAPFDGVITRRLLDRGAMVKDTATPVLTIMRADVVRVLLDIPEKDVPRVNATEQNPNSNGKGDRVILRFPALNNGDPKGKEYYVQRVASALDQNTRTMRAEVHVKNEDRALRPGMYGIATVVLQERKPLTIPSTALNRRAGKTEVYYVSNPHGNPVEGVARRLGVELGIDNGKRVEIRGGLKGDELIIVRGNGVVHDGDTVIAVPMEED